MCCFLEKDRKKLPTFKIIRYKIIRWYSMASSTLFKAKFSNLDFVSAISVLFLFLGIFNRLSESRTLARCLKIKQKYLSRCQEEWCLKVTTETKFSILTQDYSRRKTVMMSLEQRQGFANERKERKKKGSFFINFF